VLLIGRRYFSRSFKHHSCRIFSHRASQPEFEVFEPFDRLRAKIRRRSRIREEVRVRQLPQVLDRLIELSRRLSILRELPAQRFGVGEPLLRFTAELLSIFGRQARRPLLELSAARDATAVRHSATAELTVGVSLPAALLALLPLLPALPLLALLTALALLALLTALPLLALLTLLAVLPLLSLLSLIPLLTLALPLSVLLRIL